MEILEKGALFTPALIGVRPIFKNGVIRAGVKGAGVKKGPAEKGPIRYIVSFLAVWEWNMKFSKTNMRSIPSVHTF